LSNSPSQGRFNSCGGGHRGTWTRS
jgi:hypothetical protein